MKLARLTDLDVLRGAWWAATRLVGVRRRLRAEGMRVAAVPPPRLPARARLGINAVLRRSSPTCLERALLAQAWEAGQGRHRDVVVGVTAPSGGFKAHAWLDGDPRCHAEADAFHEFTRLPAGG